MSELPSGTVTFLFTDVEGSTRLLDELGAEAYAAALAEHRRILRDAFAAHGGVEVDTQGDAFFVAFPTAPGALAAAAEAVERLAAGPIRLRIGLHTGTPHLTEEGYVGVDVHRAARIAAAGNGGQVLVSASTAALVGTEGLCDLGEHRLKDLSATERVYQLGDASFPPLRSLQQTNLPVPSTPFLGRERELGEVIGLLGRQDVRLLTLTGPGGTGKTRLAAQAAGALAERYPQGVWWVPLAPLRDPELVLETAAQVLGAKDDLADAIAGKRLLLLFDNFEHVVEAAAELAGLLAGCPNLDLLVTSREPLHVAGEQEYHVPPFAHEEGVGFFLARARSIRPDFHADETVSEICRRLDELPLALELAAVRVKALTPYQILERLEHRLPLLTGGPRDAPERQRTLRAAIEWSYELLEPEEQRLFARLSVFSGGCTLEAAEEVSGADLDTLQSLVDKSLLRHTGERFWMLETIGEYAAERLEESDEAEELRRRHAEFFTALAEKAYPNLRGDPRQWLDRLDAEHNNLRAALDRLEGAGESQLALAAASALYRFWYMRAHFHEGRSRLERLLRVDQRRTAARARALHGAAAMALNTGDPATARRRSEEALALYRALGDAWGAAYSGILLGNVADAESDFQRAQQVFDETLRAFRDLGDEDYALLAATNLAMILRELGDHEGARGVYEDNLRWADALHSDLVRAWSLCGLALEAADGGRVEEAVSMARESLRITRELGLPGQTAYSLTSFAAVLAKAGRAEDAVRLLSRGEALCEEIGLVFFPRDVRMNEETVATIRTQLDDDAVAEAWEEGRKLTIDEVVELALNPEGSDVQRPPRRLRARKP